MDKKDKKQKLQFLVSDSYYNTFENIRINNFCGTTKQTLLTKIFESWLNQITQKNGRYL